MKSKTLKFQKKPIVVEAYQTDVEITIDTLEGRMVASPGDWIITGVHGENILASLIYLRKHMS